MEKLKMLNRIKELYLENTNILKYLKQMQKKECNSIEDIMISYDFQAGTYTENYRRDSKLKKDYCKCIANVIDGFGEYKNLLEVGVGECTTLGPLLSYLNTKPKKVYGFDISWSRIKYAEKFLKDLSIDGVELFTGDLFCIPLKDNSIDIVYTSHSIEPNGGKEKEALIELYRITNKYLVLLEPSYEFANEESRNRMIENGYITKLYSTAIELGYNVIEHKLFPVSSNYLNPTGIIIIEKNSELNIEDPLCCPITKSGIIKMKNAYYSQGGLLVYPIIDEIPCLLSENAIVATKFLD